MSDDASKNLPATGTGGDAPKEPLLPKNEDAKSEGLDHANTLPKLELEPLPYKESKKEDGAKWLAQGLLITIAIVLLCHYVLMFVLAIISTAKTPSMEFLMQSFNAWLPALTGLLGAAGTYYFTQPK